MPMRKRVMNGVISLLGTIVFSFIIGKLFGKSTKAMTTPPKLLCFEDFCKEYNHLTQPQLLELERWEDGSTDSSVYSNLLSVRDTVPVRVYLTCDAEVTEQSAPTHTPILQTDRYKYVGYGSKLTDRVDIPNPILECFAQQRPVYLTVQLTPPGLQLVEPQNSTATITALQLYRHVQLPHVQQVDAVDFNLTIQVQYSQRLGLNVTKLSDDAAAEYTLLPQYRLYLPPLAVTVETVPQSQAHQSLVITYATTGTHNPISVLVLLLWRSSLMVYLRANVLTILTASLAVAQCIVLISQCIPASGYSIVLDSAVYSALL
uniref:Flagellar P-ring protein n=1 Tax=Lygus hesperus TaxID=30085 RepID=A0A0A9W256_LYGHE